MSQQIRATTPLDVYFVVQSCGKPGKRDHEVISPLFETRFQAHAELTRLRTERKDRLLSVWTHTTHVEPAQWLSDVIMADGTVIPASV
jgi:hypothetical protein